MKKEIYKDNNMENNKQAENKEDNLNQFDLDVYAGTIYGTSLPGKDKTKQETLHKKSVGGHRKKMLQVGMLIFMKMGGILFPYSSIVILTLRPLTKSGSN